MDNCGGDTHSCIDAKQKHLGCKKGGHNNYLITHATKSFDIS